MITANTREEFVSAYGDIYEHTPWIVAEAWPQAPFSGPEDMIAATSQIIRDADHDRQKALVKAHPELARKFGVDPDLGRLSAAEQEGAGLDRLSEAEFIAFRALNEAYQARFDMPFVICVRQATKERMRLEIERRLAQSPQEELAEALGQIDQIALLRLKDRTAS
ncbi:2-oxo-4-hydroxy-4-carboxy-5-ureidoimidazoline decarboxylase [Asaia bogorensis]|uniref:2-oxo-4-hydroxy-4-carboxy-5-ureidoimidazoline decarboxylase n=1 Tax=Asaia bogorensis TaxID=91915 RepID=UPI002865BDE6|nr:2-oxo-4-hydroxy-4-carboxy-5-ureidoimidazoline decarboxylase [Asaia bogorensis]MDR6182386.1 2-oxo-4-hydroxy-4-carboxy-5-ureidoimidazoline decarboxylase [Asaia bogorensis NBRC 16594]